MDFITWKRDNKLHDIIGWLRKGYSIVRDTNNKFNAEAGVPAAIKVTTVKPGGTIPKLPGKVSGIGQPTFDFTLRRIRIAQDHPIVEILKEAGVPCEEDVVSKNTLVFEFPIRQGNFKYVTIWEQLINLILVQREWSDNSVSNTIYFIPKWEEYKNHDSLHELWKEGYFGTSYHSFREISEELDDPKIEEAVYGVWKFKAFKDSDFEIQAIKVYKYNSNHEEDVLENVASFGMAHSKSLTFLPHSPKGVYKQVPEEGITEEEFSYRLSQIKPIEWNRLATVGEGTHFCDNESCSI